MMVELDGLYNQEKMWDMFEHEEYTRDVVLWASKMKRLIICNIKKQTDICSDLSVQAEDRKSFVDNDMTIFYIKYSRIFKMKEFGFGLFIAAFLKKCVELTHLYPEIGQLVIVIEFDMTNNPLVN